MGNVLLSFASGLLPGFFSNQQPQGYMPQKDNTGMYLAIGAVIIVLIVIILIVKKK